MALSRWLLHLSRRVLIRPLELSGGLGWGGAMASALLVCIDA